MSPRMLFVSYIDFSDRSSGSRVRPEKMYRAFREIGEEVRLLEGSQALSQRKRRIRAVEAITREIRKCPPDYCYIESPTDPILYHADRKLLSELRKLGIPTAYFYRDMFHKNRDYLTEEPAATSLKERIKGRLRRFLYKLTDRAVANCSIVYFPSLTMASYFDYAQVAALPPGGEVRFDPAGGLGGASEDAGAGTGAGPGADAVSVAGSETAGAVIGAADAAAGYGQPRAASSVADVAAGPSASLAHTAIYVGGVSAAYATPEMLEAFDRVAQAVPDATLLLVCRAAEWTALRSPYADAPWLEVIHASGDALDAIYRRAGLALMPKSKSAYSDLSVSVKLFEYYSFGLPIVAMNARETARLVDEDGAGIVTDFSSEAFAEGILSLMKDGDERRACAGRVRHALLTKHLWTRRANEVRRRLLGDAGKAASERDAGDDRALSGT